MLLDAVPPNWLPTATFVVQVATLAGAAAVAWAALTQAGTARRRHEEQTKADRERRITESFAKAVEQLGSDKLEVRLGGIYTLERIARESEREYWPIMETLTAFVREHAPWPPRQALTNPFVEPQGGVDEKTRDSPLAEPVSTLIRPTTDVQAILTVLGRRDEKARKQDEVGKRRLDLENTGLRGAHLWSAHLERIDLSDAHLEGANLEKAHLESAVLAKAYLQGASG